LRRRKPDRRTAPRRRRAIDGAALLLGDCDPGIAVGGMQPAAPKVERKARWVGHGPRAAAEPGSRLNEQAGHRGIVQTPGSRDAGRAAANDDDLGIAYAHRRILVGGWHYEGTKN